MADFKIKTEDISELIPLGDKLIVVPVPQDRITKGGIIIPDTAKRPCMLGHVLAAGPGIRLETGGLLPMPVKRGDLVAYNRYAGSDIQTDGGSYLIMRQDDLIAKLDAELRMTDANKDVMIALLEDALYYCIENSGESHPDVMIRTWKGLLRKKEKTPA